MSENQPRYTIDSCSLIQLRRVYAYDVFPVVWDKLGDLADQGIVISVEDVYEELKVQDDVVFDWATQHPHMFLPLDGIIQIKASQVLDTYPNLIDLKKKKSGADPFVIAAALVYSCAVVTEEDLSRSPKLSKIPDVCKAYGIKCINLLELLRLEKVRITRL